MTGELRDLWESEGDMMAEPSRAAVLGVRRQESSGEGRTGGLALEVTVAPEWEDMPDFAFLQAELPGLVGAADPAVHRWSGTQENRETGREKNWCLLSIYCGQTSPIHRSFNHCNCAGKY